MRGSENEAVQVRKQPPKIIMGNHDHENHDASWKKETKRMLTMITMRMAHAKVERLLFTSTKNLPHNSSAVCFNLFLCLSVCLTEGISLSLSLSHFALSSLTSNHLFFVRVLSVFIFSLIFFFSFFLSIIYLMVHVVNAILVWLLFSRLSLGLQSHRLSSSCLFFFSDAVSCKTGWWRIFPQETWGQKKERRWG